MSEPTSEQACICPPCPGRGIDGHGMAHCAECCWGTGVEVDITCPEHGDPYCEPVQIQGHSHSEPIEVGWYAYSGIAEGMIFHLRQSGQWSVHLDNGIAADCAWGYIEQALGVWNLVPLWPRPGVQDG